MVFSDALVEPVFVISSVDRDRLRERDRQMRARMSSQAEQEGAPPPTTGMPLFADPVKITPTKNDPLVNSINSRLGEFCRVKHLLDINKGMMMGLDHHGYGSVYPTVTQQQPPPRTHIAPQQQQSASRQPNQDTTRHEFKKPSHNPVPHQRNDRSGAYGRPPDGRPQDRGNYQNQQMRQGSTGNAINRPNSGPFPPAPPPFNTSKSMNRPSHNQMSRPVHIQDRRSRDALPHQTPAPSNSEVDRVLEEMIVLGPPVSAIAATPRTEIDNNEYFFHPPTATLSEIRPPPRASSSPKRNQPDESLHNTSGTSADLRFQLALSEDSDDDEVPIVHQRMLSPIAATPAANRMEDIPQIIPQALETQKNRVMEEGNQDESSSSSGSDSGSDSDSSSDESENEKEEEATVEPLQVQTTPKVRTPPPTFEADTEEHKKRWNLASYIVSENKDTVPAPLSPIYSLEKPDFKSSYDSSEYAKSLKFKDGLPSSVSSDNFSDVSDNRNTLKDSNKIVTRHSDDSDSEDNRTNVNDKPPQKKRTTSVIYNSDSDSDFQLKKVKQSPISTKHSVPTDIVKPKSNRGRPRKIKPEDAENGEVKVKKRGRPKLPKNELKTKQRTSSISDADVQVKKRGRPKKKKNSSSDEESKNKLSNLVLSSDDEDCSRSDTQTYKISRTDELMKKKSSRVDDRSAKPGDTSIDRSKDKPNSAPFRRKSGKKQISRNVKSSETVPTSSDSDSDDEKPRHISSDSELSDSVPSKCSMKDKKGQSITPKKEEKDKDRVQDKNKSDFLRKLYTPKRDSEGGKGGGKGGAKGGKGKGGVSVFIKDGDYERSTSSIVEETLFQTNALSPSRTFKSDTQDSMKDTSLSSTVKHTTENPETVCVPVKKNIFKIHINLHRVNLKKMLHTKEKIKKISSQVKDKELEKDKHRSSNIKHKEENHKSKKEDHKLKEPDHKSKDRDHTSKERHSKTDKNNKTKEKDLKSKEKHHKSKDKDHKSKDKSSKQNKDHKEETKHKSKKRKRDHSRSSSLSVMSDKSTKTKKPEEPPSKKNKGDTEKSSNIVHNANLHPTNHERTLNIDGKRPNTDSKSSSKKEQTDLEKIPEVEAQRSSTKASSASQQRITYSNDQKPSTSSEIANQRVAYSYFERFQEPAEFDSRDHNQYLVEAKRLKHSADAVTHPIKQCLLYMDAVLYFLLTGDAMESERTTEAAAFTMFRDTLSLIKYISGRYKQQHLYSQMFTTLAVLNYRCQSRLYYKLLEMKRKENKEHQKMIAEFCNKSAAVPSEPPPNQNGGQPNATSPVSPSGSVGSIGSHSSSGYSSSDLPNRNQGMWVPMPVHNAISVQNQHFTYLLTYMDLWETADNLVQNAELTDFFIQLDRTCRPLTLHSTIRHLVSYVKRGIMLVQREMQEHDS